MLNHTTYYALPRLYCYADALTHYNNVTPIRGDKDRTKPAGRRDQKFFAIWQDSDKSINVGYLYNKEKPLVKFYTDGSVGIKTYMGAACRERVQRVLGMNLQRKHNRTWVQAKTYQDGAEVRGWFPISSPKDSWRGEHREALFIVQKHGGAPTFLNPTPVETHTKDRQASKDITAKYKVFRSYVENMAKLTDGRVPNMLPSELRALLDLSVDKEHANRDVSLCPQYSYGDVERHAKYRARFFDLLESSEPEDMYKAMLWVSSSVGGYWGGNAEARYINEWRLAWERTLSIHHRDALFFKTQSRDGVLRADRYARFFSAV
jgi:hypothetical protein